MVLYIYKLKSKKQCGSTTKYSCAKNGLQYLSGCNDVGCLNSVSKIEDSAEEIDGGNIFDYLF